jgi:hypothetical protein
VFVGTLSVRGGEVLVRVDVECTGLSNIAKYTLMENSGEVHDVDTTLGPDLDGVGVPIMAVVHLIREMRFHYDVGPVELIQPSRVFDHEAMAAVMDCAQVAGALNALATSASVQ